ncbi:uncharacterized protein CDV56_101323 [Aspergillus thermomutatus]|uniref:Major facilitator superfamily (MFS) profile domain-containing protein n=1 Tax=Aspergillus thermomutatus TaxID=41047 RepID=A0A397GA25_ASPTH|nr:uncharacterized protein CDV56_101323 [Aspergillus thermomutatus]RHZ47811.1 hypothetical protein CDV56_101323 [Aspergillus thermomutatus]
MADEVTIHRNIEAQTDSGVGSGAVYAAKAQVLNKALLDLGMGRYQWLLFLITSIGWFLDSFWMTSFVVIAPAASNEALFFYSGDESSYFFVSLFVGMTIGAAAWPWMSDLLGRKWIFTSTLVLMGMGGLVGAGMPAFTGLCVVGFAVGLAVSGNQLVDAIILLEVLPASYQYLVAIQGALWGLGQLTASAIGWAFIEQYTCGTGPDELSTAAVLSSIKARTITHSSSGSSRSTSSSCHYVSNKGWRYVWWTFGCITLFVYLCRFAFPLRETPKYLLSRRRDAEATQIVKDIAGYNRRQTWLTETSFARVDSTIDTSAAERRRQSRYAALAVITIYTVEAFASPVRGCGLALMGSTWGLFGLVARIITTFYGDAVAGGGPVWFCGAIWVVMGGAWLALPVETWGKAAA